MSLESLLAEGKLQRHRTLPREIADLLALADRGLADAQVTAISMDLRFSTGYDAALSLATIPLACAGYRTRGAGRHATTFQALPLIMGDKAQGRADLFEACRIKRNVAMYRRGGQTRPHEVGELIAGVAAFRASVEQWLAEKYPEFVPGEGDPAQQLGG